MKRSLRKRCLRCLLVLLSGTVVGVPGCLWDFWNGNLNLNVILPLGLGGNVGILNPDGGSLGAVIPVIDNTTGGTTIPTTTPGTTSPTN